MKLATTYLGLRLDHPIVASASPLSREFDGIRRLEDAGAAAIVMPSIYEEEITAEDTAYTELVEQGSWAQPEAAGGYFPEMTSFRLGGLQARLETLSRAVDSCAVPIIASLNGSTPEGWTSVAHDLQQAGAAAIELNLYRVPTDPRESSAEVEQRWVDTVRAVCLAVSIPVSVKLGPWLSAPAHHAGEIAKTGAKGLVLFNRLYQPDIDLATLTPKPSLELSNPYEIRQALLWISLLSGRIGTSLGATGGVETGYEVVKYLLAGADVVMAASSLLRHGPGHIGVLRHGLEAWMEGRGFDDIGKLRGRLAAAFLRNRESLVRSQYINILTGYLADA
jgi:dihydroorotate dehydrogenase (fumarate)